MTAGAEIITERVANIWRIRIAGELTWAEESPLFTAYPWLHGEEGLPYILFDMSGLQYVNSAGIALLIRFVREARQRNYEICACGLSAHYQKIFRIVGLTSYVELFSDEYSAMETLRARSKYKT